MNISALEPIDQNDIGLEMYRLIIELFPICRSITGNGVRQTLQIIQKHIPLEIHEIPTGTQVFDWTVPKEWNIRDAYVKNSRGDRVVDFQMSNLHVVNYSVPIKKRMRLAELKQHLHTLTDQPDWIPYRTSYYNENWGFCLSHRQLSAMKNDEYEICIDSTLEPGSLTYGEYLLPGNTLDEVLISCHICHPSLANDNLSGVALTAFLAEHLSKIERRYTYRFLFIPGTIGSITWLALNEAVTSRIKHGLVLASVGAGDKFTYKKSRRGNAEIDRAMGITLQHSGLAYDIQNFSPYGYDERQFCSPGFDLPIGCLMRAPHGRFPEYHTSADNLDFVRPFSLVESLNIATAVLELIEGNLIYLNQNPKCEPQLGKRGIYKTIGGTDAAINELALLWTLNLSDGEHSLLDIAERSGCSFDTIKQAADALVKKRLLRRISEDDTYSHV